VINQGEIIERGTHRELLEKKGFYYNLYMSQFKGTNLSQAEGIPAPIYAETRSKQPTIPGPQPDEKP